MVQERRSKEKGGEESVMFMPYTQNSELKKRCAKQIQRSGVKIKVIEMC